jgi:hypothetical protein
MCFVERAGVRNPRSQWGGEPSGIPRHFLIRKVDIDFRNGVFAGVRDVDVLRGRGWDEEGGQQHDGRETSQ